MTFDQLLQLIPDSQEMILIYEGFSVNGKKEAIACMLCDDVYKGIAYNVEAEDDVLKVWVKEHENA